MSHVVADPPRRPVPAPLDRVAAKPVSRPDGLLERAAGWSFVLFTLARFASSRRTADGVAFTSSLAALVLLRSSIHVLLMLLVLQLQLMQTAVTIASRCLFIVFGAILVIVLFLLPKLYAPEAAAKIARRGDCDSKTGRC